MLPHPSFFFWTLCGQEWKLAGILSINLMDKGATHCKAMWLQNSRTDCCMKPVLLKSKNKKIKITESSSLIGACIALLNPFSLHQLPCPWVISSQPVWVVHKRFAFVNFCEQTLPAPKQTLTTPDFFFFLQSSPTMECPWSSKSGPNLWKPYISHIHAKSSFSAHCWPPFHHHICDMPTFPSHPGTERTTESSQGASSRGRNDADALAGGK